MVVAFEGSMKSLLANGIPVEEDSFFSSRSEGRGNEGNYMVDNVRAIPVMVDLMKPLQVLSSLLKVNSLELITCWDYTRLLCEHVLNARRVEEPHHPDPHFFVSRPLHALESGELKKEVTQLLIGSGTSSSLRVIDPSQVCKY